MKTGKTPNCRKKTLQFTKYIKRLIGPWIGANQDITAPFPD